MNNLARLMEAKGNVTGLSGITSVDPEYLRAIEAVSREFERATRRHYSASVATRYFTGQRKCRASLLLPFDAATITGLTLDDDGDGTYEITLVEGTDYFAYREDDDTNKPIYRLDVNPNGTQISVWPTAARALKFIGLEGYSYELESTTLTLATTINASVTSLTASAAAGNLIYPGDTLVLDSEQMEVTSVSAAAVSVKRAINGTTAAEHTDGAVLYIRRYPREVEEIIRERVRMRRWDAQMGNMAGSPGMEEMQNTSSVRGARARWFDVIEAFRREWAVG